MERRRPTATHAVLAAALGCALAGCEGKPGASTAAAGAESVAPRGLILVSIDTLRADHLSCYGYERATSPAIDALAARGALFEEAVSSASWTVPAHMSMLTGLYPRSHGVDERGEVLPAETRTLAERLAPLGFATAGIVNGPMLGKVNFSRGFQEYTFVPARPKQERGVEPTLPEGSHAVDILARAEQWLRGVGERRFFLFLHLFDAHSDYEPAPEYEAEFARPYAGTVDGTTRQMRAYLLRGEGGEEWGPDDARHLVDLYDGEIRQLDQALSAFVSFLASSGLADETLLVLTSDHGEEFLEHGAVLHGRALYREILHVPLILAGPGIPRGARYGGEVSPVDLVPTLLGALDLEAPAGVEGIDLSAAWRDPGAWPPRRAVFSETRSWAGSEQGDFRARIRRGPWTLDLDQRSGKRRLFHLEEDPAELADASSRHPDVARELWSELEGYLAGTRGPLESTPASQEELEALQALGYR